MVPWDRRLDAAMRRFYVAVRERDAEAVAAEQRVSDFRRFRRQMRGAEGKAMLEEDCYGAAWRDVCQEEEGIRRRREAMEAWAEQRFQWSLRFQ